MPSEKEVGPLADRTNGAVAKTGRDLSQATRQQLTEHLISATEARWATSSPHPSLEGSMGGTNAKTELNGDSANPKTPGKSKIKPLQECTTLIEPRGLHPVGALTPTHPDEVTSDQATADL